MSEASWNSETLLFIIATLWSAVGFTSYYFLSGGKKLAVKIWKANSDFDVQAWQVFLQRTWGFFFLGLIPALFILVLPGHDIQSYGLGFTFYKLPPWWIWMIFPLFAVVGYFNASKPGNLALYPQIRTKKWTPGILIISGFTWIVFLVGYEFLFRGFLLFASLSVMDPWSAIALNCSLYAFAHIYKGPGETFGAIPLGILLCHLTIITGNIWSAVLIHSAMALTNEWQSMKANPDIKVVKSIKPVKS